MNLVEQLLKADAGKVEFPKKEVTLKLEKLGGVEATFTCTAFDPELVNEINQMNMEMDSDGQIEMNTSGLQLQTLLNGIPELKDQSLRDHFKVKTPDQLINKIFLAGDINKLVDTISELNGFDKKTEKKKKDKIKNS